jgi:Ca2+-binding RTX toxin-like protein
VVPRLRAAGRQFAIVTAWAAAALAVTPSLASGATLRYEVVRDGLAIGLTGGPGEANRVTVSREGQGLLFADRIVAPLRLDPPTTSCRRAGSPQELRCSAPPGGNIITLTLQDGDDVATVRAAEPTILVGGAGNDTLTGGSQADDFDGGTGNDTIVSRDGTRETVACGPGFDRVTADALDVAAGCESVSRT